MQSINKHMNDYCELIEAFNRVEAAIYRSPLIFVEREANKTRAVLERALVCVHGVRTLQELNLKMPKVLRNKLTVMDKWADFKQYRDENWDNRVPGTPINRSFENLYSSLERDVICYRTGLPSIYPEYYYEQLAISTLCFTALVDVLGVRYENSEIVSRCLSAEIWAPHQKEGQLRTLKEMIVACVKGLDSQTMTVFQDIGFKLAKIGKGAAEDLAELRKVRSVAHRLAITEMYPEELFNVLKLRVKKELHLEDEAIRWDSLGFGEVLSRVQLLIKSAEVAVEKARSDTLEINSRFMIAALTIVRDAGSDS